jgi:hypothetical protein
MDHATAHQFLFFFNVTQSSNGGNKENDRNFVLMIEYG